MLSPSCRPSLCHLPAWPCEAPAWRLPESAVPGPRQPPDYVRVETGWPHGSTCRNRDNTGWKTDDSPGQSQRRRDIQVCGLQPHRVQWGTGQSGYKRWVNHCFTGWSIKITKWNPKIDQKLHVLMVISFLRFKKKTVFIPDQHALFLWDFEI